MRQLTYKVVIYSNQIACKKRVRLGLNPVIFVCCLIRNNDDFLG